MAAGLWNDAALGIRFAMSRFIARLAFTGSELVDAVKVGNFAGSGLSACSGYLVLPLSGPV